MISGLGELWCCEKSDGLLKTQLPGRAAHGIIRKSINSRSDVTVRTWVTSW
jgi:hypothetical protein